MRFPPPVPHRVVVIDNASSDASRRTAEGAAEQGLIDLIRRDDAKNERAAPWSAALDLGFSTVESPLVMTLDSDAWVRREGWYSAYREALGESASHAGLPLEFYYLVGGSNCADEGTLGVGSLGDPRNRQDVCP